MGKILILLILVVGVLWLVRTQRRASRGRPEREAAVRELESGRCDTCGLYLPRADGIEAGGRFYCSEHAPGA